MIAGQVPDDLREISGDMLAITLRDAVRAAGNTRTAARMGKVGISGLGDCRRKTTYAILETEPDPEYSEAPQWKSTIGIAVGDYIESCAEQHLPYVEKQVPLDLTLPSGKKVSGTADLILGTTLIDNKVVGDIERQRRHDPDLRYIAQVVGYGVAARQAGLEIEQVAIAFWDRHGDLDTPYVWTRALDDYVDVLTEVDRRLDDVTYAVMHGIDEASRDLPEPVCKVVCPFYHSCRDGVVDASGLLDDEDTLLAVKDYKAGRAMEAEGKRLKDEAKAVLAGVSGSTGEDSIYWTTVGEAEVPGFRRASYNRLTIRALRKRR